MKILLLLFLIAFITPNIHSKIIKEKLRSSRNNSDTWNPITKFTMGFGTGYYTLKIWNPLSNIESREASITLLLFTYENWKLQKLVSTCREKQQFSVYQQKIVLPLNGTAGSSGKISLGQSDLVQVWYFVLANCDDIQNQALLQNNPIMYNLTIINSDGSQISEEENGVMTVLILTIIPIFVFFIFNSVRLANFYTNQAALDYPLMILVFTLVLEFLASSCELLHLYFYSLHGKGDFVFDWVSFIFSNLSQLFISILLLLMASGWTVKTLTANDEQNFATLGAIASLIMLATAITGKISTNDIDSFHDYENFSGILTVGIKFGFYVVFAIQLLRNYDKSDPKLRRHYQKLGVFGSIYLLSFPLTILAVDILLPPYYRHKTTTYVTLIAQSTALLVYASMLSFKESEYYPIVYKNNNILPLNKVI